MPNQEELQKNKQKKKDQQTSSQNTADRPTTSRGLEDFIDEEEENFEEKDFEEKQNNSGIGGINESEATALLTNMIAGNIPEKNRQEFLNTYPVRVETLLKFVGFQELTEGANVKQMPSWVRIAILVVGVGGLTFATVKKYQPEQNYEEQKKKEQKEEGWQG